MPEASGRLSQSFREPFCTKGCYPIVSFRGSLFVRRNDVALTQLPLSQTLEDLLAEAQELVQSRDAVGLSSPSGDILNVPLGRPKVKFKFTGPQVVEMNQLLARFGPDHPKTKDFDTKCRQAWAEARGREDAVREAAKLGVLNQLGAQAGVRVLRRRPSKTSVILDVLTEFMPIYIERLKTEQPINSPSAISKRTRSINLELAKTKKAAPKKTSSR